MGGRPTGATRVVGVIGDPIEHSLSPVIHNAAFQALGLDWVYVAFAVPVGAGERAVRATSTLGLGGLSVTMPHKGPAARACDRLTPTAATLRAVNTVVVEAGGLLGDSTDGEGFLRAATDERVDLASAHVVVLGSGGAARAIVQALDATGARISVAARRADAGRECAALAEAAHVVGLDELDEIIPNADVVVNATPVGMQGEDPPFSSDRITPTQLVMDIVYAPRETPLLAAARARGASAVNGIPMLVHQAAISFERWTGQAPPLDVMRAAAEAS